jgi:type VI secretion system secreted protein VgrG
VVAELRPWLWLLSLTRDCRIFQAQDVPAIVTTLCQDLGFADLRNDCIRTYEPLDYCVQYNETGLDFVHRLLEEAGIAYHFEHAAAAHTLVLVDDPSGHPTGTAASLAYAPLPAAMAWGEPARLQAARLTRAVVSEAAATDDYNFEVPATDLAASLGDGTLKVYEYPARVATKAAADARVRDRLDAIEALACRLEVPSSERRLAAGTKVTVTGHPDPALADPWLLAEVRHEATPTTYANRFTACPADKPLRPPARTPRPRIAGAQTAKVVGPADSKIWTDQYGRVKVRFFWDQLGADDDTCSCWVRVAQGWAGAAWGAMVLPRIGHEVVVTFLDGDPDRPLVTGAVYNADNTVPYPLADHATRTTLKSRSSAEAEGFNELRLEDKAGSEEVYLHAQKDLLIEVIGSRTTTLQDGHDTLKLATGNRTVDIAGNEDHKVAGNMSLSVTGNLTIKASGSITINAGGSLTLSAGASMSVTSGLALDVKAGTALGLEGGTTMELKGAASGTVDGGGMLTVKGGLVKIN